MKASWPNLAWPLYDDFFITPQAFVSLCVHNETHPIVCVRSAGGTWSVSRRSHDTSCSARSLALSISQPLSSSWARKLFTARIHSFHCGLGSFLTYSLSLSHTHTHRQFFPVRGRVKPRTLVFYGVYMCVSVKYLLLRRVIKWATKILRTHLFQSIYC